MKEIPRATVLTLGSVWSDMFEQSLSRKLAWIDHLALGNPRFTLAYEQYLKLIGNQVWKNPTKELIEEIQQTHERLNRNTKQASELLFKFDWFVSHSDIVMVDTGMLDTAIGHHLLILAQSYQKPALGVGVTPANSPLAPAFLKAIVYPATPDDLVAMVLQHVEASKTSGKEIQFPWPPAPAEDQVTKEYVDRNISQRG